MSILLGKRERNRIHRLQKCREIAARNGGECLSSEYINQKTKLRWECRDGHKWPASPLNIFHNKTWCPYCNRHSSLAEEKCRFIFESLCNTVFPKNRRVLGGKELDGFSDKLQIAFEHNGRQHYECVEHFKMTAHNLQSRQKSDIDKCSACKSKGISLIVIPYWVSRDDNLLVKFIVAQLTDLGLTINSHVDLEQFYSTRHDKISQMQEFASQRSGRFVSTVYRGGERKHIWECSRGHKWNATPQSIKQGRWCPKCAFKGINKKYSLDDVKHFARKYGGSVLSDEYITTSTKMKWLCACGNIFNSTFDNLRLRVKQFGYWCLKCKENYSEHFTGS